MTLPCSLPFPPIPTAQAMLKFTTILMVKTNYRRLIFVLEQSNCKGVIVSSSDYEQQYHCRNIAGSFSQFQGIHRRRKFYTGGPKFVVWNNSNHQASENKLLWVQRRRIEQDDHFSASQWRGCHSETTWRIHLPSGILRRQERSLKWKQQNEWIVENCYKFDCCRIS